QTDRRWGHRGASRSLAADLPLEGQERPQGRRAAGQAPRPGGGAGGARPLRRGPDLARADHPPPPGERPADPGPELGPPPAALRRRRAPEAARPVDEEGAGVAPSAGAANGVAATATRPAAGGDRGADEPGAADRARVESPGGALAGRGPAAEHPRGGRPHGG